MNKHIWFDMDGTIYNLYKIPGWLDALREGDMTIFSADDMARKSLPEIRQIIRTLQANGWEVGVITWAPIGVGYETPTFSECEYYKTEWIMRNFPEIKASRVVCLEYGEAKSSAVFDSEALNVLVDDNKEVRKDWRMEGANFLTINANRGYIKELASLIC